MYYSGHQAEAPSTFILRYAPHSISMFYLNLKIMAIATTMRAVDTPRIPEPLHPSEEQVKTQERYSN